MTHDRRSVLATIGLALPFGIGTRFASAVPPHGPAPVLRLRPFEEAVREAFEVGSRSLPVDVPGEGRPCRRIEIGHSEGVLAGVQGCHNDRPFAGFPVAHLRIVRLGSGPGPIVHGVRLYVATVDVALTEGREGALPSRPLNFAILPPAPVLTTGSASTDEFAPKPRPGRPKGQGAGSSLRTGC
ncbi:hypothetical protein J8F10_04120 [Gemmata sp. G18]|uniref:Uncharacterized protein n=1 Tax=Gemmata palustris TaxID=2822762 RepID=A0ABS5BLB2_9BACT|nr:hypothetical protein [Gemmata palustris]MBP3954473.1 hypothetical protein [Gemmata palustris]